MDPLIERVSRWIRPRAIEWFLAQAVISVAFITILNVTVLALLLNIPLDQWSRITLVALGCQLMAAPIWLTLLMVGSRPARHWLRDPEHGDPAAALETYRLRIPQMIAATVLIATTAAIGAEIYAANQLSLSPLGCFLLWVFITAMAAGAGAYNLLLVEQIGRPLFRDAAAKLPADYLPAKKPFSLSARLLILLPAMNLLTAELMTALFGTSLGREGTLAVAIGGTLLLSLTLPLLLALLLRRSLLTRLRELRDAVARIGRGDLTARLNLITGDELDEIGREFNRMVAGLREREALRERNIDLSRRIVASSDEARRKVERDLHDGAQQHLVLLDLKLGMAERQAAQGTQGASEALVEARADLQRALAELRDLAHGIYPSSLSNDGLRAALEEAVNRSAIPASIEANGTARYPAELEAAVYFCCLEALQNAAKYAGEGARATVILGADENALRFEVRDDGAGFDAAATNGSAGLRNMADRIGALDGEVSIDSKPGEGTRVSGSVPIGEDSAAQGAAG
jgi:signal transduction histidine kinase